MIAVGLENPTPDVSKAIAETEAIGKGRCSLTMVKMFHLSSSLITSIILNISCMFSDADQKPADNLAKQVALDMDILFSKTKGNSKGVLFNVWQSFWKSWDLTL